MAEVFNNMIGGARVEGAQIGPAAGTDHHVFFGGRKISSLGPREQGGAAAEFHTQLETADSRAGEPE